MNKTQNQFPLAMIELFASGYKNKIKFFSL